MSKNNKLKVFVCIGSSCHLKGSRDIFVKLREAVEDHDLSDEVKLAGSFCLGKCSSEGVSVKVDDEIFCGVTTDNFDVFFQNNIISKFIRESAE